MFRSYRQGGGSLTEAFLITRALGDRMQSAPIIRAIVRNEDSTVALESVMTMEDRVARSLERSQAVALSAVAYESFALLIAGVGLSAVLLYTVTQRTREIVVRTALGATAPAVIGLVMRDGLLLTAKGMFVGLTVAYLTAESLSKILYGTSARDPLVFMSAAASWRSRPHWLVWPRLPALHG